jgi:RNA polymerase sigma factor (TIGR02999 family)
VLTPDTDWPSSDDSDAQTTPEVLLREVYDELRKLAAHRMALEKPGQTLQATALVHEAWVKLTKNNEQRWQNRAHFFAAASEAMRRILIDRARKRGRKRHGSGLERVDLENVESALTTDDSVLLALDQALAKLAREAPDKAELVKLRFFTGMKLTEAAEVMDISLATAKRRWAYSRAWLLAELTD